MTPPPQLDAKHLRVHRIWVRWRQLLPELKQFREAIAIRGPALRLHAATVRRSGAGTVTKYSDLNRLRWLQASVCEKPCFSG